jgi:ATP-binding cassette subfamily B protein
MAVGKKIAETGKEYFDRIRKIVIRGYVLSIFSTSLIEPISVVFIAAIFTISYKTSLFNFAALAAIIYLAKQIFSYLTELQDRVIGFNSTFPYLKKVLEYQREVLENKEKEMGRESFRFDQALEFRDVYFSYQEREEVLSGVNFRIKKGETVGLVGPSGAGKTTIVDLALRLFLPRKGKILLDNKDIAKISLKDWRENIGYVSQDIFLLNDTIANNIRFYDNEIADEEIIRAAKMANIYDFIQSCQDGFSTMVGERGVLLSAGQRQRVCLARALARKLKLLILDEATSHLDSESEKTIKGAIKGLKGRLTIFIIAHRLSTLRDVDRLLVLGQGKIIEEGPPSQLLRDKTSYFSKVYHLR